MSLFGDEEDDHLETLGNKNGLYFCSNCHNLMEPINYY
jgi:hypothetical protein